MKTTIIDLLVRLRTSLKMHKIVAPRFDFASEIPNSLSMRLRLVVKNSRFYFFFRGQLAQDVAALKVSNFQRNGYFVEVGAADGKRHSNTYLLEKGFDWKGLVAEPAQIWHAALRQNRSCLIDLRYVSSEDNQVINFVETLIPTFSTSESLIASDHHLPKRRENAKHYNVSSISLTSLLEQSNAPTQIDYLSLDTEGSELEILLNFNWEKYRFKFISVEHNFSSNREEIASLLSGKGYRRILSDISRWDDWFVPNSINWKI